MENGIFKYWVQWGKNLVEKHFVAYKWFGKNRKTSVVSMWIWYKSYHSDNITVSKFDDQQTNIRASNRLLCMFNLNIYMLCYMKANQYSISMKSKSVEDVNNLMNRFHVVPKAKEKIIFFLAEVDFAFKWATVRVNRVNGSHFVVSIVNLSCDNLLSKTLQFQCGDGNRYNVSKIEFSIKMLSIDNKQHIYQTLKADALVQCLFFMYTYLSLSHTWYKH